MADGWAFNPVGAHTTDATVSSAETLTRPTGANALLLQAFTQAIRYTLDGTTPTASTGFRLAANSQAELYLAPGATVKLIEETASASVQYQWGVAVPVAANRGAYD